MYYEILDKDKQSILPLLKPFKKDYYLAGGTALALQLGHRQSVDFDFFNNSEFNTANLFKKIKQVFSKYKVVKVQEDEGTLSVIVNKNIKLSFFHYPYRLVMKPTAEENFRLASIIDIACMKLSAITSRATTKDYVDLYFILQNFSLAQLLKQARKKMPDLNENLALKSLIYFKDIEQEKINFKRGNSVAFSKVKLFLEKKVKEYMR